MPKAKEAIDETLIEDVVINDIALRQELKEKEKQILDLKKSNEEITSSEFNIRKTLQEVQNQVGLIKKEKEEKEKQIEYLKVELNKLATLLDEYIKSYQEQVKMLSVAINNTQLVGKYLDSKVEAYNKGDKK